MIRFTEDEVCTLVAGLELCKHRTGSEYMWEQYDKLQSKLMSYGEEVTTDPLSCQR